MNPPTLTIRNVQPTVDASGATVVVLTVDDARALQLELGRALEQVAPTIRRTPVGFTA